jgi:hypothetical protein
MVKKSRSKKFHKTASEPFKELMEKRNVLLDKLKENGGESTNAAAIEAVHEAFKGIFRCDKNKEDTACLKEYASKLKSLEKKYNVSGGRRHSRSKSRTGQSKAKRSRSRRSRRSRSRKSKKSDMFM